MTIIELFDKTSIENMISTLLVKPEKVYFMCHNKKQVDKKIDKYIKIAKGRGIDVKMESVPVNRNNLESIVESLSRIIDENNDCHIDLSGGDDLYLVAAGIVYEKYNGKVELHRFNVRNNSLSDLDNNGRPCIEEPIEISIEENIGIYGGTILDCEKSDEKGISYDEKSEFAKDILNLWQICKNNPRYWNSIICCLNLLQSKFLCPSNPLSVSFEIEDAKKFLALHKKEYISLSGFLNKLKKYGLITDLVNTPEKISFVYKKPYIKKTLAKAGTVLELFISILAFNMLDSDKKPLYNDVVTSVVLDWDGEILHGKVNISNEIDIMLMKGLVPVFISCKNGDMDIDELYKLSTVAERFGGEYAKKVLVTSELDALGPKGEIIRARAEDMKIRILDDIDSMSKEKLENAIKTLWNN